MYRHVKFLLIQGPEAMGDLPGRRPAMGEDPGRSGASGEVPGRRSDDAETGSDDSTPYCQPCVNVLATAFCKDCRHYLCSPCTDYHCKLQLTKTHKLLVGSAMPSFYGGRPLGATARGKLNPLIFFISLVYTVPVHAPVRPGSL